MSYRIYFLKFFGIELIKVLHWFDDVQNGIGIDFVQVELIVDRIVETWQTDSPLKEEVSLERCFSIYSWVDVADDLRTLYHLSNHHYVEYVNQLNFVDELAHCKKLLNADLASIQLCLYKSRHQVVNHYFSLLVPLENSLVV